LIAFPLAVTVTTHASCHVIHHWRAKVVHIFEIPDLNLSIHCVTFWALRRALTQVKSEK